MDTTETVVKLLSRLSIDELRNRFETHNSSNPLLSGSLNLSQFLKATHIDEDYDSFEEMESYREGSIELFKQIETRGDGYVRWGDLSTFILAMEVDTPDSPRGLAGGGISAHSAVGLPTCKYTPVGLVEVERVRTVRSITMLPYPINRLALIYEGEEVVHLFLPPSPQVPLPPESRDHLNHSIKINNYCGGISIHQTSQQDERMTTNSGSGTKNKSTKNDNDKKNNDNNSSHNNKKYEHETLNEMDIGLTWTVPTQGANTAGIRAPRGGALLRHHTAYKAHDVLTLCVLDPTEDFIAVSSTQCTKKQQQQQQHHSESSSSKVDNKNEKEHQQSNHFISIWNLFSSVINENDRMKKLKKLKLKLDKQNKSNQRNGLKENEDDEDNEDNDPNDSDDDSDQEGLPNSSASDPPPPQPRIMERIVISKGFAPTTLIWSRKVSLLFTGNEQDGMVMGWDIKGHACKVAVNLHQSGVTSLLELTKEPSGDVLIVSGSTDGCLSVWDVMKGISPGRPASSAATRVTETARKSALLKSLELEPEDGVVANVAAHECGVACMTYAPFPWFLLFTAGIYNVRESDTSDIRVFEFRSSNDDKILRSHPNKKYRSLKGHRGQVTTLLMVADEAQMVSTDSCGCILVWCLTNGISLSQSLNLHSPPLLTSLSNNNNNAMETPTSSSTTKPTTIRSSITNTANIIPDTSRSNISQSAGGTGGGNTPNAKKDPLAVNNNQNTKTTGAGDNNHSASTDDDDGDHQPHKTSSLPTNLPPEQMTVKGATIREAPSVLGYSLAAFCPAHNGFLNFSSKRTPSSMKNNKTNSNSAGGAVGVGNGNNAKNNQNFKLICDDTMSVASDGLQEGNNGSGGLDMSCLVLSMKSSTLNTLAYKSPSIGAPIIYSDFNPYFNSFVTASTNQLCTWDATTGKLTRCFLANQICGDLDGHSGNYGDITAVKLEPLGRHLIVGDSQGKIYVIDYVSGARIRCMDPHSTGAVIHLCYEFKCVVSFGGGSSSPLQVCDDCDPQGYTPTHSVKLRSLKFRGLEHHHHHHHHHHSQLQANSNANQQKKNSSKRKSMSMHMKSGNNSIDATEITQSTFGGSDHHNNNIYNNNDNNENKGDEDEDDEDSECDDDFSDEEVDEEYNDHKSDTQSEMLSMKSGENDENSHNKPGADSLSYSNESYSSADGDSFNSSLSMMEHQHPQATNWKPGKDGGSLIDGWVAIVHAKLAATKIVHRIKKQVAISAAKRDNDHGLAKALPETIDGAVSPHMNMIALLSYGGGGKGSGYHIQIWDYEMFNFLGTCVVPQRYLYKEDDFGSIYHINKKNHHHHHGVEPLSGGSSHKKGRRSSGWDSLRYARNLTINQRRNQEANNNAAAGGVFSLTSAANHDSEPNATETPARKKPKDKIPESFPTKVMFLDPYPILAAACDDRTVRLWALPSLTFLATLTAPPPSTLTPTPSTTSPSMTSPSSRRSSYDRTANPLSPNMRRRSSTQEGGGMMSPQSYNPFGDMNGGGGNENKVIKDIDGFTSLLWQAADFKLNDQMKAEKAMKKDQQQQQQQNNNKANHKASKQGTSESESATTCRNYNCHHIFAGDSAGRIVNWQFNIHDFDDMLQKENEHKNKHNKNNSNSSATTPNTTTSTPANTNNNNSNNSGSGSTMGQSLSSLLGKAHGTPVEERRGPNFNPHRLANSEISLTTLRNFNRSQFLALKKRYNNITKQKQNQNDYSNNDNQAGNVAVNNTFGDNNAAPHLNLHINTNNNINNTNNTDETSESIMTGSIRRCSGQWVAHGTGTIPQVPTGSAPGTQPPPCPIITSLQWIPSTSIATTTTSGGGGVGLGGSATPSSSSSSSSSSSCLLKGGGVLLSSSNDGTARLWQFHAYHPDSPSPSNNTHDSIKQLDEEIMKLKYLINHSRVWRVPKCLGELDSHLPVPAPQHVIHSGQQSKLILDQENAEKDIPWKFTSCSFDETDKLSPITRSVNDLPDLRGGFETLTKPKKRIPTNFRRRNPTIVEKKILEAKERKLKSDESSRNGGHSMADSDYSLFSDAGSRADEARVGGPIHGNIGAVGHMGHAPSPTKHNTIVDIAKDFNIILPQMKKAQQQNNDRNKKNINNNKFIFKDIRNKNGQKEDHTNNEDHQDSDSKTDNNEDNTTNSHANGGGGGVVGRNHRSHSNMSELSDASMTMDDYVARKILEEKYGKPSDGKRNDDFDWGSMFDSLTQFENDLTHWGSSRPPNPYLNRVPRRRPMPTTDIDDIKFKKSLSKSSPSTTTAIEQFSKSLNQTKTIQQNNNGNGSNSFSNKNNNSSSTLLNSVSLDNLNFGSSAISNNSNNNNNNNNSNSNGGIGNGVDKMNDDGIKINSRINSNTLSGGTDSRLQSRNGGKHSSLEGGNLLNLLNQPIRSQKTSSYQHTNDHEKDGIVKPNIYGNIGQVGSAHMRRMNRMRHMGY